MTTHTEDPLRAARTASQLLTLARLAADLQHDAANIATAATYGETTITPLAVNTAAAIYHLGKAQSELTAAAGRIKTATQPADIRAQAEDVIERRPGQLDKPQASQ